MHVVTLQACACCPELSVYAIMELSLLRTYLFPSPDSKAV